MQQTVQDGFYYWLSGVVAVTAMSFAATTNWRRPLVIYLDSSVLLASVFREPQSPRATIWDEELTSGRYWDTRFGLVATRTDWPLHTVIEPAYGFTASTL